MLRYGLVLALFSLLSCAAAAASPSRAEVPTLDTEGLRTIADWLRDHGRDGYIGADVADVMELPRMLGEELLAARQRGFKSDDELRIAQVPADERQDFILFMVQRPDDQVYFYFSTVRDGLKKAFVSIPSRNLVMPLDRLEAEARFRQEVRYWGERMESR